EVDYRVGALHAPRRGAETRERKGFVAPGVQRAGELAADQTTRSRDRHPHVPWMRERSGRFASALLSAPVNELCWVSLQVPDLERSRAFWRDVIGLSEKSYTPGWVELELRPGLLLALHPVFYPNAMIKRGYDRGGPVLGIRIMNLEEMAALVLRHGARALGSPQEIPGGISRDFEDPDGIVFVLEGGLFLVIHLMIAGRFRWLERGAKIPGKVGLAALDFPSGTLVLTEAATKKRASIHLARALDEFERGGIEPLACTLEEFAVALRRENHTLKRSLTDPRLFSGIGNAYSDEILHRAKLSPA